jgi:hypothetical protein
MSTHIEYVGFKAEGESRDYRLRVRDGAGQPREFVVAIPNEAFTAHHVRYQDAPDLCFKVLAKALAASADAPNHVMVTEADIDEYRLAHAPKPPKRRARPTAAATAEEPAEPAAATREPKARERTPFGVWRW